MKTLKKFIIDWIYQWSIRAYVWAIKVVAPFHDKARLWVQGRRHNVARLNRLPKGKPVVWMHCASLGEFEQGRPLIEAIRTAHPSVAILLTFFSPSGFELRKDYPHADVVAYLPPDLPQAVQQFLDTVRPSLALFVKYEFWRNYLQGLHQRQIPTILVSARFHPGQIFFKPWGGAFRQMLHWFTHIFVQDAQSKQRLEHIGVTAVSVAGDTRVDRVAAIAAQPTAIPAAARFRASATHLLICGSTWPTDEKVLAPLLNHLPKGWKAIIAPHETDEGHIHGLCGRLKVPYLRYSQLHQHTDLAPIHILIIDNVGMLSHLYQYGHIAYIGGGFGKGIHNTLEPMAFGLPVLFGPHYRGFAEAEYLVASGGGRSVCNSTALQRAFAKWLVPQAWQQASQSAQHYIEVNTGASMRILQRLEPLLQNSHTFAP